MTNEKTIAEAKKLIDRVMGNTTVTREQTAEDLAELREYIDELLTDLRS